VTGSHASPCALAAGYAAICSYCGADHAAGQARTHEGMKSPCTQFPQRRQVPAYELRHGPRPLLPRRVGGLRAISAFFAWIIPSSKSSSCPALYCRQPHRGTGQRLRSHSRPAGNGGGCGRGQQHYVLNELLDAPFDRTHPTSACVPPLAHRQLPARLRAVAGERTAGFLLPTWFPKRCSSAF